MNPIDELPTEAEREAARKLVAILEPLTPVERRKLIDRYIGYMDGQQKFREIFGRK